MQNVVSLSLVFPINTEARIHRLWCSGIMGCWHYSRHHKLITSIIRLVAAAPHTFTSQGSFSCINLHALLCSITRLLIILGLLRDFWLFIDRISYFFVLILEGHQCCFVIWGLRLHLLAETFGVGASDWSMLLIRLLVCAYERIEVLDAPFEVRCERLIGAGSCLDWLRQFEWATLLVIQ